MFSKIKQHPELPELSELERFGRIYTRLENAYQDTDARNIEEPIAYEVFERNVLPYAGALLRKVLTTNKALQDALDGVAKMDAESAAKYKAGLAEIAAHPGSAAPSSSLLVGGPAACITFKELEELVDKSLPTSKYSGNRASYTADYLLKELENAGWAITKAAPVSTSLGGGAAPEILNLQQQLHKVERHMEEFGALADYWHDKFAKGEPEPSIDDLIKQAYLRPAKPFAPTDQLPVASPAAVSPIGVGAGDLVKELQQADEELEADGYKSWCYTRLAIGKAIKMAAVSLSSVRAAPDGWVSIDERLPKHGEEVSALVADLDGTLTVRNASFTYERGSGEGQFEARGHGREILGVVLMWHPLPDAPARKEAQNEVR